ncbi:unnamed protein product [Schistocephalus solidus]|uniref:Uncharacterized protein n=1 Tax=Schistocephalus solidus TaxID=70667 RepID=A0A183TEZ3_SCHSO|nr:unnamed protein product [Schistocephalus solidus]
MERVSSSEGCPHKLYNLTVYGGYDFWVDRMKVYLEAVDEGACPAAILGRLDNEIYTVARAAHLTASLTPTTIFERLWREFGRSNSKDTLRLPDNIELAEDSDYLTKEEAM